MSTIKVTILESLKDKLNGEHPEVVQAIESQIEVIAAAQEKLDIINKHF